MKTLSQEPEIIAMANALRLAGDPVLSIIEFCRKKISRWIEKYQGVRTIWDLERLVCEHLNLVIHEVWNDDDLERVIRTYLEDGDFVFATLRNDLNEKTFATLIRRKSLEPKAPDRYVAVVDCRGGKAARRFFSRWHEIAHLLTLYKQLELPFHRSTTEKDPTEKLMDIIAGEVGFYDPLFNPVLEAEIQKAGGLTFEVVENVRFQFCPEASMQATLNACAARVKLPVIVLEAGMSLKKTEQRRVESKQAELLPSTPPKPQLRVLSSMSNAAARTRSLQIPRYMRVPNVSVLATVFKNTDGEMMCAQAKENLVWWSSSDGNVLPDRPVRVEAMKVNDRVVAIISLAEGSPRLTPSHSQSAC